MRLTRLVGPLGLLVSLSARYAAAQTCYSIRSWDSAYVATNPFIGVAFPNGQHVTVDWPRGIGPEHVSANAGGPYYSYSVCPGKPLESDLYFDAGTRPGVRFRWWIGDPRKPLPQGGPQDPAVRAFLKATLGFPAPPRKDQPDPNHPERLLPYYLLDAGSFSGDSARIGVKIGRASCRERV